MNASTIYRLQHQQAQILPLIKGFSAAFLSKRHLPGKWSIAEHIAHLGRYQEVFADRIGRVLQEEEPEFERYVADADPGFARWCRYTPADRIEKLLSGRLAIAKQINSIGAAQISRRGHHPKFGAMSIEDWTTFFLLHESHHHYTIFRMKRQFIEKT